MSLRIPPPLTLRHGQLACRILAGARARARGCCGPQRRLSRWPPRRRARARGGLSGLAARRR